MFPSSDEDVEKVDKPDKKLQKRHSASFIVHGTGEKTLFTDENGNLKFVNFICRRPIVVFFLSFASCILSVMILSRLIRDNPITEDTNAYDIHDVRSIAYDTLRLAKEDVMEAYEESIARRRRLSGDDGRPQEEFGDVTYWIYEAKTDDGLFNEESISVMRAAEATILENEDYPNYCKLDYEIENKTTLQMEKVETPECRKPLSAMNFFYASEWNSTLADEIINLFKGNQDNIDTFNRLSPCTDLFICDQVDEDEDFAALMWTNSTSMKIDSIIEKWDGKGELNPDLGHVTEFIAYLNALRTKAFHVSFYVDANFDLENPVTMYSRSIVYWGSLLNGTDNEDDSAAKLKGFILADLRRKWDEITEKNYSTEVQSYYFMGALIWDLILLILANDGLRAFGSFVAVFFYLRYMLGSWFLTAVGMFEIVMSLPLSWLFFSYIFQIKYFSALNTLCIFIVMAIGADDIFVFMDSYKQSAGKGPDVLKSFETRMSWVYRRSGSAMLLTSVTTCSAFLCTLISPIAGTRSFGIFAAFVIWFDYVLVMTLFCTSVVIYHDRFENKNGCCNCTFWKKSDPSPTETAMDNMNNGIELKIDPISRFFKEKLGPFILNGRNRLIVGAVLTAWVTTSIVFTARLRPTTTAEQFLDDSHPLQIGATIITEEFSKTQEDLSSQIHFIWGLNEISRDGVNQLLDPKDVGKVSFSSDFTFDEECQSAMLDACTKIRTDEDLDEFILVREGRRSVHCFVEELGAYNVYKNETTCRDVIAGEWKNVDWEVSTENLASTLGALVETEGCNQDRLKIRNYYQDSLGWNGTDIRYAGISFESSILDPNGVLAEEVTRSHYDKFIELASELDKTMEGACKTKTVMTDLDQKFIFMDNQEIYRTSAVSGSMIGVAVAFAVIFLSTRKLHISFFATLCILCVLLGVIGSVTMLGWTLGTIEAILISILAGFSVDYVIHLAHAYSHAEGDCEERIMEAFGEMGTSVFSGMLTSVVASIPLFFCTLTFFAKFGTFLCLTIVLSWIFANFGFMSLLATFKVSMDRKWV